MYIYIIYSTLRTLEIIVENCMSICPSNFALHFLGIDNYIELYYDYNMTNYDMVVSEIDSCILNSLARASYTPIDIYKVLDGFLATYRISLQTICWRFNELQQSKLIYCNCQEQDILDSFFTLRYPIEDLPIFSLSDDLVEHMIDEDNMPILPYPSDALNYVSIEDDRFVVHLHEQYLQITEIANQEEQYEESAGLETNDNCESYADDADVIEEKNETTATYNGVVEDEDSAEAEEIVNNTPEEAEIVDKEPDHFVFVADEETQDSSCGDTLETNVEPAEEEQFVDQSAEVDQDIVVCEPTCEYETQTNIDSAEYEDNNIQDHSPDDEKVEPGFEEPIPYSVEETASIGEDNYCDDLQSESSEIQSLDNVEPNDTYGIDIEKAESNVDEKISDEERELIEEEPNVDEDIESVEHFADEDHVVEPEQSNEQEGIVSNEDAGADLSSDDDESKEAIADSELDNNTDEEQSIETSPESEDENDFPVTDDIQSDPLSYKEVEENLSDTNDKIDMHQDIAVKEAIEDDSFSAQEAADDSEEFYDEEIREEIVADTVFDSSIEVNQEPHNECAQSVETNDNGQFDKEIGRCESNEEPIEQEAQSIAEVREPEKSRDNIENKYNSYFAKQNTQDNQIERYEQRVKTVSDAESEDVGIAKTKKHGKSFSHNKREIVDDYAQYVETAKASAEDVETDRYTLPPRAEEIALESNGDDSDEKKLSALRALGLIHSPIVEKEETVTQDNQDSQTSDQVYFSPVHRPQSELELYLQHEENEQQFSYKSLLSNVFKESAPQQAAQEEAEVVLDDKPITSFSEFREEMRKKGYTVKQYVAESTYQYYTQKYININKIKFATSILTYIVGFAMILIAYFALEKYASLGIKYYIAAAAALLVVPGFYGIRYICYKERHAPANFSFKLSIVTAFIASILLMMIFLLLAFFLPSTKANISDITTLVGPIFYPMGLLLLLPISVVLYALLYKSKRFHL